MIKVLKTDLFRLIKSKAFYVYPTFILVIVILGNILAAYVKEMEEETDTQGGLTVTAYEEGTETDIVNADIEIKTGKAVTDSEKEKLTVKISTVEFFGTFRHLPCYCQANRTAYYIHTTSFQYYRNHLKGKFFLLHNPLSILWY